MPAFRPRVDVADLHTRLHQDTAVDDPAQDAVKRRHHLAGHTVLAVNDGQKLTAGYPIADFYHGLDVTCRGRPQHA